MVESQYKVRATRRKDSGYDLSYGRGSKQLNAVAEPDGQRFVIAPTSDKPLRGMLRELKVKWGEWAMAVYHGVAPQTPSVERRVSDGLTDDELIREQHAGYQQQINDLADEPFAAISLYVTFYNLETVALAASRYLDEPRERLALTLPKNIVPNPPLAECYAAPRDQYVWPSIYDLESGEVLCRTSPMESVESTTTPTTSISERIDAAAIAVASASSGPESSV